MPKHWKRTLFFAVLMPPVCDTFCVVHANLANYTLINEPLPLLWINFSCWNGYCFSSNLYIYFILDLIFFSSSCLSAVSVEALAQFVFIIHTDCLLAELLLAVVWWAQWHQKYCNNKALLSHCFCITVFMLWEREKWTICYVFTHYVRL